MQHVKLKSYIHNYYTIGYDRYPNNRQNDLNLLTQYTKPNIWKIANHKENPLPSKPVMEVIIKHMTIPTVNIKSATIFTKEAIHISIVQTRIRKRTMTTKSPSLAKKVKPVLKNCPKI